MTELPNKEILFFYESKQNPNGDPGFDNQPRVQPDGTLIVTDVRLKRTIRDYLRDHKGKTIFVDYNEKGEPQRAKERVIGLLSLKKIDEKTVIKDLIIKTSDVPLFGALVPIQSDKSAKGGDNASDDKGSSAKFTGPVQFSIGRSVNIVTVINPQIVGRFVGDKKANVQKQHSTFGKFYSVEYALIKFTGVVFPKNLGPYFKDEEVVMKFKEEEAGLADAIWNGTNSLVSRSKYPQRSIFYLEIAYDGTLYNDLGVLVRESPEAHGSGLKELPKKVFDFSRLVSSLKVRKPLSVKIRYVRDISDEIEQLAAELARAGIKVDSACTG